MKTPLHIACTSLALACAGMSNLAWAQAGAAAAQRSVEESQSKIPVRPGKSVTSDLMDLSGAISMDRLEGVEVKGDRLQGEIRAYWKRHIGKEVSIDQMIAFKTWFYDLAKSNGFMAYAQTEAQGNTLVVTLVTPRVNSIRVYAKDEDLAKRYINDLNARFEADFKPGMPVNVLALEQKLEAISFSMPLELDVIIRSAGPELLDLIVNVTEAITQSGKVLGGLVQINNYGLKQYGRGQVLGQLSIGGHAPTSRLTLTAQKSQGITYGRGEYDMPVEWLDARFHTGGGYARSESIFVTQTRSVTQTSDVFAGLDKIVGYRLDTVFKGSLDLTARDTHSHLSSSGVEISRVSDAQVRMKFAADNEKLSTEPMRAEVTAVLGHYGTVSGLPNVNPGSYTKLEFNARKQLNLTDDGEWFGLARVRGQLASRHMDGYNQISVGGANGVRAYSTADGVGDDGFVSSLELNRRIRSNQTAGLFYDGGVVRASKIAQTGLYTKPYALQALGAQLSGNVQNLYYNVAIAKGLGGNKGALATDMDTRPNNWRLTVAGTYVF